MSYIEMLGDLQLTVFLEYKSRWDEFEKMCQEPDIQKKERVRAEYEEAINRKKKEQISKNQSKLKKQGRD